LPGAPYGARDGAAMVVVPTQTRLSIFEALTQIAFGKAMRLNELETLSAQDHDAMELAGKKLAEAASEGLVKVFGYLKGATSYKRISPARFDNPIHWQFTHDEFWHDGLWEEPEKEKRVDQWEKVKIDGASLATWLANLPAKLTQESASKEPPKRADTKELIRAYKRRADDWPKDKPPPNETEDRQFLNSLHGGISRDRTRDIRRQNAPDSWKRGGRRKSRG